MRAQLFILNDISEGVVRLPLGHIGVCLTTLSSALSYLLGAPRILLAVARDSGWQALQTWIAPPTDAASAAAGSLAGSVSHRAALRALVPTWLLAQLIVLTGTVNYLAPLVTGLFLLAFCLINLLAFLSSLSAPPPSALPTAATFTLRSRVLSLLGFILSALTMAAALASSPPIAVALCCLLIALLVWRRHALAALVARHTSTPLSGALTSGAMGHDGTAMGTEERVERAAAYVHDALAGRFRGVHWAVGARSRLQVQSVLRSLRYARVVTLIVYLSIAFFEQPSWCYGLRKCGKESEVVHGGLPSWRPRTTQSIEAVCITFIGAEMALKAYGMSPRAFFLSPWHVIQLLLLVLNGSIVAVQMLLWPTHTDVHSELLDRPQAAALNYLNPMLRPILFVAISRTVRRSLRSFFRVFPAVSDMLLLMVALLAFFSAIGCLLFGFGLGERMDDEFGTVGRSLTTLFILLTTSNFPDAMLPVYQQHRSVTRMHMRTLTRATRKHEPRAAQP